LTADFSKFCPQIRSAQKFSSASSLPRKKFSLEESLHTVHDRFARFAPRIFSKEKQSDRRATVLLFSDRYSSSSPAKSIRRTITIL